MCLRASIVYVPMCLHANVPKSMPTCHKACQCFNLAYQEAKQHANFSAWLANVPKSMPIFQTFLLQNAKGNFYTVLLYKKFFIILDIILIHIMCMYRTYKLYYAILFETFLLFRWKWKYKNTWFLYVTSNKGILWSSWIMICLSWRSKIIIKNLIMIIFLSVSYDYVFEYCSSYSKEATTRGVL